jgi:hypothetical protein
MSISLISSKVPSVITTNDYGLRISYPNSGFLKQNTDLSVRFWAYNITNGKILTNTTINCTYNLLNVSGFNIWTINSPQIKFGIPSNPLACQNCFNLDIKGGNFTYIGYYNYQIRCQGLTIGGYTSGDYIVTGTGLDLTEGRSILYFSILFFLLFLFTITVMGAYKLPSGNDRNEEGQLININNLKYLKSVLLFFAYLLVMSMTFLGSNIFSQYLGENLFFKFLFLLFQIQMGLLLPIVVIWFVWIFVNIFQDKKIKGLISHGIYPNKY